MIVVTIINILVVVLAYIFKNKYAEKGLKVSFIFIFIFLALRYDYGNDYMGYFESFNELDHFDFNYKWEIGWQLLCLIFKPFGFFPMVVVLAAFNCIVYYRFIKKYVPYQYYWMALFLYVFTPSLMLVHSSAMRQSVAIAIFIISIDCLQNKKFIKYFILITLAYSFHQSAIILFPVYLLTNIEKSIKKSAVIILFVIFVLMLIGHNNLKPLTDLMTENIVSKYTYYEGGTNLSSGLGLIAITMGFMVVLHFASLQFGKKNTLLFSIFILSYYFIPLGLINMMAGRFSMYFQIMVIAIIPIIYSNIKNRNIGRVFVVVYMFVAILSYISFFYSELWIEKFYTYKTIFSAL